MIHRTAPRALAALAAAAAALAGAPPAALASVLVARFAGGMRVWALLH